MDKGSLAGYSPWDRKRVRHDLATKQPMADGFGGGFRSRGPFSSWLLTAWRNRGLAPCPPRPSSIPRAPTICSHWWACPGPVVASPGGAHVLFFHFCLLPVRLVSSLFLQEKKEFEQKLAKEQGALREQLQVSRLFQGPLWPPGNIAFPHSQHSFGLSPKGPHSDYRDSGVREDRITDSSGSHPTGSQAESRWESRHPFTPGPARPLVGFLLWTSPLCCPFRGVRGPC